MNMKKAKGFKAYQLIKATIDLGKKKLCETEKMNFSEKLNEFY